MPKETPIIPTGIPNPVGPAVIPGIRNKLRIGGEVPKERYPLVCHQPIAFDKSDTFMGTHDYNRLVTLVKPISHEDPDAYKERLERLREESKLLQMGWCDNKKDLVKQLAEKFLSNTQKDIDIREMEERKKIQDAKPKPRQSWSLSLTGNNERKIAIQSGLVMTEVLAQRAEHEQIAKRYKELCRQREEHEQLEREKLEQHLTRQHAERNEKRNQYYKSLGEFQRNQALTARREKAEAKMKFDQDRREFVTGLHDDAQAKAYMDYLKEEEEKAERAKYLLHDIKQRSERKQNFEELEDGLLTVADNKAELQHADSIKEKTKIYQKTLRIGARQEKAAQLYKENVLNKIVDKEDEKIAREVAEEDELYWQAVRRHQDRKTEYVNSLHDFQAKDDKIREFRKEAKTEEKSQEYDNTEEKFRNFIKEVGQKSAKKMAYEKSIAQFWDDQVQEKKDKRKMRLQQDEEYLEGVKFRESVDEDSFEREAETLINVQQSLGRETYPIRKNRDSLCLGKGPPVVASDNFDNKIYSVTRDIFYKPIDSRNRLSINWDPDYDKNIDTTRN